MISNITKVNTLLLSTLIETLWILRMYNFIDFEVILTGTHEAYTLK